MSAPPAGQAVIYRDSWGVPHIQARREGDGFFALGYAIAQDNLEDTLRQHVIGRGEMARYFGHDYVEIDRLHALFRIREEARAGLQRLPAPLRRDLDAYVEGFNRYLADHPSERPAWAAGLRPEAVDLVGFSQFFTLLFPVNLMQGIGDCRRGGVDLPNTLDLFVKLMRTGGPADASTGWALSPWRTRDGVAIHLADPHNALDVPSPEFRIHAGDFEFAGYMVGLLMVGHSRHVAWGTTFGSPDTADCYLLPTAADDPAVYLRDGARQRIERKQADIAVKGGAPVRVTLEYALIDGLRAPIVARQPGKAFAVATPYLGRAEGSLVDIYHMVQAKNLAGIQAALSDQGLFPVGLTAADSSGSIGYFRIGRTPVRDDSIDWSRPVTVGAATDWKGLHPFTDLVRVIDPKQGYVRETNRPAGSMWGGDNSFHYPAYRRYILGEAPEINDAVSPVSRGVRADEVLSRSFALTDQEAQAYVFDETWAFVVPWQAALRQAMPLGDDMGPAAGKDAREAAQRILRFDGVADARSVDALAFHYWQDAVAAAAAAAHRKPADLGEAIRERRPLVPADAAILVRAVGMAAAELRRLGQWDARYGDVFRIGREARTYPIGGCGTPFTASLHTFVCEGPGRAQRKAVAGQKQIMLTVFSDPIRSYSWAAYGQQWRGRPQDPHYDDQSPMNSDHRLKPVLFERDELMSNLESTTVLKRRP